MKKINLKANIFISVGEIRISWKAKALKEISNLPKTIYSQSIVYNITVLIFVPTFTNYLSCTSTHHNLWSPFSEVTWGVNVVSAFETFPNPDQGDWYVSRYIAILHEYAIRNVNRSDISKNNAAHHFWKSWRKFWKNGSQSWFCISITWGALETNDAHAPA